MLSPAIIKSMKATKPLFLSLSELSIKFYTINLINFPSRTNISGYLKNSAQI